MHVTMWLVAGGAVFLVGFVAGARFEEGNLELRERRLARLRRRAREGGEEYPEKPTPPVAPVDRANRDRRPEPTRLAAGRTGGDTGF